MDPTNLATKLATSLSDVVPKGFRVYEEDGMVCIQGRLPHRGCAEVASAFDPDSDVGELAAEAALEVLKTIADYVTEETKKPWPGGGSSPSVPQVTVEENALDMWFENRDGTRALEIPRLRW